MKRPFCLCVFFACFVSMARSLRSVFFCDIFFFVGATAAACGRRSWPRRRVDWNKRRATKRSCASGSTRPRRRRSAPATSSTSRPSSCATVSRNSRPNRSDFFVPLRGGRYSRIRFYHPPPDRTKVAEMPTVLCKRSQSDGVNLSVSSEPSCTNETQSLMMANRCGCGCQGKCPSSSHTCNQGNLCGSKRASVPSPTSQSGQYNRRAG